MNKSAPDKSPKPLWFVADFVRRTSLEYIGPLCPLEQNPNDRPKFNVEKYQDCLTRSMLIASIISEPARCKSICGAEFDFGLQVRDAAQAVAAVK